MNLKQAMENRKKIMERIQERKGVNKKSEEKKKGRKKKTEEIITLDELNK